MHSDLVPAGWLSAPDLVSRVSQIIECLATDHVTAHEAQSTSCLIVADAMAQPRPGLAAFVHEGGWAMISSKLWLAAIDNHLAGGRDLVVSLTTGTLTGTAFASLLGRQPLFSYVETMVWLEPLVRLLSPSGSPEGPPWGSSRNRTPWLETARATQWADALLIAQGRRVSERGRRTEFEKHFELHGDRMASSSIDAIRNRAGWPIRAKP